MKQKGTRACLIGDYRYSSAVLNGVRYAIVRNGERLERIRRVTEAGNPVIWDDRMPISEEMLAILTAERGGMPL